MERVGSYGDLSWEDHRSFRFKLRQEVLADNARGLEVCLGAMPNCTPPDAWQSRKSGSQSCISFLARCPRTFTVKPPVELLNIRGDKLSTIGISPRA